VAVPWSLIVPAKRLTIAKTRLRPASAALPDLAGDVHDRLVLALLADTVAAAVACALVAEVVVVTDEAAAADVVRRLGARTVPDEPDRGLNPALEHGAATARSAAVAALSSDLPALRPAELEAALTAAAAAAADGTRRCFVADAPGTGTTLLTADGVPLRPRFGPGSAAAHADDGARHLTGDWPGLTRDVDTDDDLRAAAALGVGRWTAMLLDSALAEPPGAAR
jgi:2-phospho-L-lactate guanylyltransferase